MFCLFGVTRALAAAVSDHSLRDFPGLVLSHEVKAALSFAHMLTGEEGGPYTEHFLQNVSAQPDEWHCAQE